MGGKCEKTVFGIQPLAKNCHFGESLSTGIKVYSLGINTYYLQ